MSPKTLRVILVLSCLLFCPGFGVLAKSQDKELAQKTEHLFGPRSGKIVYLTLKECLAQALAHYGELRVADDDLELAKEKEVEASHIGTPILEYEYDLGPAPKNINEAVDSFFSGDLTVFNKWKVGVGVPLTTFGKVKTGRALARVGIEAEKEKKVKKKAEVILKIKQLYNGILLAREVNRLLSSAHDGVYDQIKEREAKGGTDPTQLLKLKLFRAELEKRIQEGETREILAKEALGVQVGMDPKVHFEIESGKLRPVDQRMKGFEEYRQEASQWRSDLKLLELGTLAKETQLTLEKRLMTPNLAAGAFFEMGYTPNITNAAQTDDFTDPFNFTRAGIGLQLKGQFDFHSSFSKVRQVKREIHKLEIQKELAAEGVELEVKEAFLEVQSTHQDVERAEEAGKLSRQLLFLTQSNYDIGLADPEDFIDALKSFLETRGQYFEAVFHYNVAVAQLDQKVGRVP